MVGVDRISLFPHRLRAHEVFLEIRAKMTEPDLVQLVKQLYPRTWSPSYAKLSDSFSAPGRLIVGDSEMTFCQGNVEERPESSAVGYSECTWRWVVGGWS